MSRYLNQTQAAKHYGVKRQSIGHVMKPGKALYEAIVDRPDGRMIDMEHPAAVEYRKHERPRTESGPRVVASREMSVADIEPEVRAYWGWTLENIVQKCGTMSAFSSLLQAADKIESIHSRRLESDRKTGELIPRDYVSRHVLGLVERICQRMLTDMPTTLSLEVHGRCSTGATVEDVREMIQAAVSDELSTLKADTKKQIRKAGA
jgi:hypothetical protein